jgi:hypothetical protein
MHQLRVKSKKDRFQDPSVFFADYVIFSCGDGLPHVLMVAKIW